MYLQKIILTNFKNYPKQTIELSPKLNCFTGLNGMGKTNILDAVYYLCMCKSHFSAGDNYVVQTGQEFFRIEGNFVNNANKILKVVAKVQPRKNKVFEHDNVVYDKLSEHIGKVPIVMIAPDDVALITEGSEERRRLMDITISQLDQHYLNALLTYNKIIEQRNALLKQLGQSNSTNNIGLLDIYDSQLLAPAQYIFEQRQKLVAQLSPVFQHYYGIISNQQEQPNCFYESKLLHTPYIDLLKQSRDKDRILQRTTAGIHRDDIVFYFDEGSPAKRFASQGQLKSFLLAIKLAQHDILRDRTATMPILLLDDIFDKLDAERVRQLLHLLSGENFGQILVTDTQKERVLSAISAEYPNYKHFHIQQGQVNDEFHFLN